MNVLAIDTATEACSVALLSNGETDVIFELCPQQQSQQILPMVDTILKRNDMTINDVSLLAYGRGPGSFTGVRIAASTIQGLALGADLPVAQISTMAMMAQENAECYQREHTLVMIDARMAEVYCAEYTLENGLVTCVDQENVLHPDEVINRYQASMNSLNYAGTGFDAYSSQFVEHVGQCPGFEQIDVLYPNAKYMINLAIQAFEKGDTVMAQDIAPVYVRDTVTWKKLPHKQ